MRFREEEERAGGCAGEESNSPPAAAAATSNVAPGGAAGLSSPHLLCAHRPSSLLTSSAAVSLMTLMKTHDVGAQRGSGGNLNGRVCRVKQAPARPFVQSWPFALCVCVCNASAGQVVCGSESLPTVMNSSARHRSTQTEDGNWSWWGGTERCNTCLHLLWTHMDAGSSTHAHAE